VLKCSDGRYCCDGNRSFNCCNQSGSEFFTLDEGSMIASISTAPTTTIHGTTAGSKSASNPMASNSATKYPSTLSIMSVTSSASNSLSSLTTSSIAIPGYTPPNGPSNAQKLGLKIGLSVGAVLGVILMLLIHVSYRCWKRRHNPPRIPPYGLKDNETRQDRISWIETWKKRLSKFNSGAPQSTETINSENKYSELPAEEVSVVPGRMELSQENAQSIAAGHRFQDSVRTHNIPQYLSHDQQPHSPVSDLSGDHSVANSRVVSTISPVIDTFQQQHYSIAGWRPVEQGYPNMRYYASAGGLPANGQNEPRGLNAVEGLTLVELPADEIDPPHTNTQTETD
jgi:hypothetical protein